MRNILTVIALLVSVSGIGVSLAREEMRCFLGLSDVNCNSANNNSPSQVRVSPSSQPPTQMKTEENIETQPENQTATQPETKPSPTELSKREKNTTDSLLETEPVKTKPQTVVEVSPQPSEVSNNHQSQSEKNIQPSPETVAPLTHAVELEVIPPPEETP